MSDRIKCIKINANGNKPCVIPISSICCITEDAFFSRLTVELVNGNKIESKMHLADVMDQLKEHTDIIDLVAD